MSNRVLPEKFYEEGTWEHHGVCFRCKHQGWTSVCRLITWHSKGKSHKLGLCFRCLKYLDRYCGN